MQIWKEFLRESIGSAEQIERLRVWIGKMLSGDPSDRMLLLAGDGPCGKTTLLRLLQAMVGESKIIRFMPDLYGPHPQTRYLAGKRLVVLDPVLSRETGPICGGPDEIERLARFLKPVLGRDFLPYWDKQRNLTDLFSAQCAVAGAVNLSGPFHAILGRADLYRRIELIYMSPVSKKKKTFSLFGRLVNNIDQIKAWAIEHDAICEEAAR